MIHNNIIMNPQHQNNDDGFDEKKHEFDNGDHVIARIHHPLYNYCKHYISSYHQKRRIRLDESSSSSSSSFGML